MQNRLYQKVLLPSNKTNGEEPILLVLTEEVNGLIFWETGPDGSEILFWEPIHFKDRAIERAVVLAEHRVKGESEHHELEKAWTKRITGRE